MLQAVCAVPTLAMPAFRCCALTWAVTTLGIATNALLVPRALPRDRAQRLVVVQRASDDRDPPRFASAPEPDDIERGVDGVKDLAQRTTGLLGLGLTFWMDLPFARIFAVFSVALTALLYRNLGDSFVARAPPEQYAQEASSSAPPRRTSPSAMITRPRDPQGT